MQTVENAIRQTPAGLPEHAYIGKIPVRNLWLLLLYASNLFRQKTKVKQGVEESPDNVADLVAEILTHHVAFRIRRNLSLGYLSRKDNLKRVRGRIDLFRTKRRHLLQQGMIACRYEELSIDTPRNRYVAAALRQLAKLVSSRSEQGHQCRLLAATLEKMGVGQEKPMWSEVAADRIGRHNADERHMLDAAHLAFELALPTEMAGTRHRVSPDRDDQNWIRKLFEKAVCGFYDVTLSRRGWRVQAEKSLSWPINARSSDVVDQFYPSMRTDIVLENKTQQQRIIIDTKFTNLLQKGRWNNETLKSGHLYQIYAYIRTQELNEDPLSLNSSGLLLYPSVGIDVNESATIQGHEFRFATVDLAAETSVIRAQLFQAIGVPHPA